MKKLFLGLVCVACLFADEFDLNRFNENMEIINTQISVFNYAYNCASDKKQELRECMDNKFNSLFEYMRYNNEKIYSEIQHRISDGDDDIRYQFLNNAKEIRNKCIDEIVKNICMDEAKKEFNNFTYRELKKPKAKKNKGDKK